MGSNQLLEVKNLHVSVEDEEILHGVDLTVNRGETHVLMGPNGAGKSTLGYALVGNPRYQVTAGEILFKGQRVEEESVDKRARAGMFLSFQNPLEVPGITLSAFHAQRLGTASGKASAPVGLQEGAGKGHGAAANGSLLCRARPERGLLRRRKEKGGEILQMLMLKPDFAILDETDSGLDVDSGPHGIPRHRGISQAEMQRRPAYHHPQHAHSGTPARGLHPHSGGRPHGQDRRRVAGGGDQRARLCRL